MYCVFTPRVCRVGRCQTDMSRALRSSQLHSFSTIPSSLVQAASRCGPRRSFAEQGSRSCLGLIIHSAIAQAPQAPQTPWSITPNCNATGTPGGRFTDSLGAVWGVLCAADLSGYSFHDQGTNGQGIYGCFKDCDNRPQCTGFVFVGNPDGGNGGTTGQTS
jgi:hypothetical protein